MGGPDPVRRRAALAELGGLARVDVPLGPLTTYRVGGPAAIFVEAATVADLLLVARAVQASGLPVLVVGRGSNLLVADAGFPGVAVTMAGGPFSTIELDVDLGAASAATGPLTRELVGVRAGAAVDMPVLARRCAAAGLTGMEWAVGIPGSIGGAVRMNAGGHGADISATLRRCRSLELTTGRLVERGGDELAFGYRRSAITSGDVVISADFLLAPGRPGELGGDHPRDRALEARASTRWSERRLRVHQSRGQPAPRLGRLAGRGLRAQGVPARHGHGLRQARQLHPGRSGGVRR